MDGNGLQMDLETFIRTHMKPSLRVRVTWVGHDVDFNLGVNSNPSGVDNAYQYRGIGNLRWQIANFGSAGSYVETDMGGTTTKIDAFIQAMVFSGQIAVGTYTTSMDLASATQQSSGRKT